MAYSNWKGLSHYRVHSLYKGHLPITDTSARSRGVRNLEVPLYSREEGLMGSAPYLTWANIRDSSAEHSKQHTYMYIVHDMVG